MSKYAQTVRNAVQSPTSFSIEALEEIIRNCQRNEERLHELERHTRHERKKAERLLRETYQAMQSDLDRTNSSILENKASKEHSTIEIPKTKYPTSKQFFITIDDENDENIYERHRKPNCDSNNDNQNNNNNNHTSDENNNSEFLVQNKHLLERVEKLLAGDGTTTSSDIMSSQERQKPVVEKATSPIDDDFDDKLLNIDDRQTFGSRQLRSACSIEHDLSAVDHLLSERTPVNHSHRVKSDNRYNQESQSKQTLNFDNEKRILPDEHDQRYSERINNYIRVDQPISPKPERTTMVSMTSNQSYHCERRSTSTVNNKDEELNDLARRCEDLLARLHSQRNRAAFLENSINHQDSYRRRTPIYSPTFDTQQDHPSQCPPSVSPMSPTLPPPMSLQQSLELLRPEFISRSRQRVRRIHLLREEREHNAEIDRDRQQMLLFSCTNCCMNSTKRAESAPASRRNIAFTVPHERSANARIPVAYNQMKKATKKKYEQLPEVIDRRRQDQMEEIRRRNVLRAKLFRARLRQHVARHGRTNINESLTIIDA